jgi:hypothetical protein
MCDATNAGYALPARPTRECNHPLHAEVPGRNGGNRLRGRARYGTSSDPARRRHDRDQVRDLTRDGIEEASESSQHAGKIICRLPYPGTPCLPAGSSFVARRARREFQLAGLKPGARRQGRPKRGSGRVCVWHPERRAGIWERFSLATMTASACGKRASGIACDGESGSSRAREVVLGNPFCAA